MSLADLFIHQLVRRLGAGEVSSVEATEACLERQVQTSELGAFLRVDRDGALAAAAGSDNRRAAGESLGTLDGVPLALKDNIILRGMPTTCGSEILRGFQPPFDSFVARRLEAAGAVLLGKLNLDEFAMGSSNERSAAGRALNPWDRTRVPGGSSGGAAVAVATGAAFAALGSDTGGSVRQPASFCNTVGFKPTYGRVSRYGLVAFTSSMDQIGPLTRDVTDGALILREIAGHDPDDATSAELPVADYLAAIEQGCAGLRLGVPREFFADGLDPEVRDRVEEAIATYRSLGAEIVEISLPHTDYAVATYYLLCTAEAASNLGRFDGIRFGQRRGRDDALEEIYRATRGQCFGEEVKRRILLGTFVLSAGYHEAYHGRAQRVRTLICRDFVDAFEQVDAIVTPTTPTPAFGLGEYLDDPVAMYLADLFTVSPSLAGLPALSLPCGFCAGGLPIGLQLIAPPWQEASLLRLARAYEREQDWHQRRPDVDV